MEIALARSEPSHFVEVYPHGDVVLVCGRKYGQDILTKILVSSVVMSTGSMRFEAMFNIGTKEAASLHYARSGRPLQVELPYDRPSAMLAICYIMHRRYDMEDVLVNMKPEQVMRVAELGVTYNLMPTLRPAMQSWLECTEWHLSEPRTVECLLTAAFLCRHEGAFRKLSRDALLYSSHSISISNYAAGVVQRIKPVLAALHTRRSALLHKIMTFIEQQIVLRADLRKSQSPRYTCTNGCSWAEVITANHIKQLKDNCLFPAAVLQEGSIADALKCLPRIIFDERFGGGPCNSPTCVSNCRLVRSPNPYRRLMEEVRTEVIGSCLPCFLGGSEVTLTRCEHAG